MNFQTKIVIFSFYKKRDITKNPQYEILAKCLLPEHMLEWFELTNVEVQPKEKKANHENQAEEYSPNVIHLYLDENDLTPDNREDLRPNGFTPAKSFHDFPIRGQEVLLHVRRLLNRSMPKSRTSELS